MCVLCFIQSRWNYKTFEKTSFNRIENACNFHNWNQRLLVYFVRSSNRTCCLHQVVVNIAFKITVNLFYNDHCVWQHSQRWRSVIGHSGTHFQALITANSLNESSAIDINVKQEMLLSIVPTFDNKNGHPLLPVFRSWLRFLYSDSLSSCPGGGSIFVVLHSNWYAVVWRRRPPCLKWSQIVL